MSLTITLIGEKKNKNARCIILIHRIFNLLRYLATKCDRERLNGTGREQTKWNDCCAPTHTLARSPFCAELYVRDECTLRKRIPKRTEKKTCFETSFHYNLKECLRSSVFIIITIMIVWLRLQVYQRATCIFHLARTSVCLCENGWLFWVLLAYKTNTSPSFYECRVSRVSSSWFLCKCT